MANPTQNAATVLVIEDEAQMQRVLRVILESAGYKVVSAQDGRGGITQAAAVGPDIVILDLGLPDMHGLSVLQRLREWTQVPVIVLSVRSDEEDKVMALDGQANDYITKPFNTNELLARMRAAQRLAKASAKAEVFHCGPLSVDLVARSAKINGQPVKLTLIEYSLLALFVRNAGRALTHDQIVREVWGDNNVDRTGSLRVHIARLREKLEPDPDRPRLFLTESGVGYRMAAPE